LEVILFGMATSLALVTYSSGQTVQTDQADLARNQSALSNSGTVEGAGAPSASDADLGEQEVLKRSDRYQPFTATAALPFYWTSNVALVREGEQSDFLLAPAASLSYQPKITDTLFALVSVRDQLFYYDRFDNLNFGSFDVEAGLICLLPEFYNLILRGEYYYNRLTVKNSFDDFFTNNSIILSVELPIQIGRAQRFSFGADANISLAADPEEPRRNDYEVYLGYSVKLARAFSVDAVGRVVLRDYYVTDRKDVSEILSLSANCSVTRFLTASAISTLAANQSNHSVFDYDVANVGGLVSLSIKF
jgi:hypothetical protein